jgi:hypothetical protein
LWQQWIVRRLKEELRGFVPPWDCGPAQSPVTYSSYWGSILHRLDRKIHSPIILMAHGLKKSLCSRPPTFIRRQFFNRKRTENMQTNPLKPSRRRGAYSCCRLGLKIDGPAADEDGVVHGAVQGARRHQSRASSSAFRPQRSTVAVLRRLW